MIPKVIHYCWFGNNKKPPEVKKCIESWKKYCPNFKIIEWNESNFDVYSHPFVYAAYNAKAWAFVSDFARLKIIYEYGGIYLDTDVELIKQLDLLLHNKVYFGIQAKENLCNTGLGFGAEKNNQIIKKMLEIYDRVKFDVNHKNGCSCPWLNTKILEQYGYVRENKTQRFDSIVVYSSKYFDPYPSGVNANYMCEKTISIHHYSDSWGSNRNRMKRKIIRLIGHDFYLKLKKFKNYIGG